MSFEKRHIYLAAGGTGGHVFPALSVAQAILKRGDQPFLFTDPRGQRMLPPMEGLEVIVLPFPTWTGGLKKKALFCKGLWSCIRQVQKTWKGQPVDLVMGFGGYPSLPPLIAAMIQGRPLMLHEQNAYFGKVNRFAARPAQAIATSFSKTFGIPEKDRSKVEVTGMPVRSDIAALHGMPYELPGADQPFRILVLGGSQGASFLADIMVKALALLPEELRRSIEVVQQARPEGVEHVRQAYRDMGVAAHVESFFYDMAAELEKAHLVVSRAGASSVFELMAAGRPALLIPLPSAANDHQSYNARMFEESGGGKVLPQALLTPALLAEEIKTRIENPLVGLQEAEMLRAKPVAQAEADLLQLAYKIMK